MIDIVCVLLECSLRATRHLAVFVEFTLSNRCWTRPEEDVAANELAFLDALKGLVVARKCVCQFHIEDGIIIICNQAKNELYSLRAGGVGGSHIRLELSDIWVNKVIQASDIVIYFNQEQQKNWGGEKLLITYIPT